MKKVIVKTKDRFQAFQLNTQQEKNIKGGSTTIVIEDVLEL